MLTERLDRFELDFDGTAFFQANSVQAAELFRYAASLVEGQNLLELYCGVGALTVFLAQKAAKIRAVEVWTSAVAMAQRNEKYNRIEGVEVIEGAAENVVSPELLDGVDCVVVDPPRTGCEKKVVEAIAASGVKRVLYISCNPATLARDAALLRDAGFVIDTKSLKVFDMFPQTCHVETVTLLSRRKVEPRVQVTMTCKSD